MREPPHLAQNNSQNDETITIDLPYADQPFNLTQDEATDLRQVIGQIIKTDQDLVYENHIYAAIEIPNQNHQCETCNNQAPYELGLFSGTRRTKQTYDTEHTLCEPCLRNTAKLTTANQNNNEDLVPPNDWYDNDDDDDETNGTIDVFGTTIDIQNFDIDTLRQKRNHEPDEIIKGKHPEVTLNITNADQPFEDDDTEA